MTSALTTLQQWLLFTSTTLAIGVVAWRLVVFPATDRLAMAERRAASVGLGVVGVLLVAWALRMVVQVMGFRDPFVPLWDDVSFLLFEIFFGTVWMAQGVVIVLLGAVFWAARRGAGRVWTPAAALVASLAVTLALSGHAYGADNRVLAVAADALHTLGAGIWIGTLAVILTVGRAGGNGDPTSFANQIRAFSPMALVSGCVLVAMGAFLSWTHLTAFSDLWTLTYGRILSAKIGLALVIFGLGAWNWRKGLPDMDTPSGAAGVRRRGGLEVALAAGVILLTAVLVHSAKP